MRFFRAVLSGSIAFLFWWGTCIPVSGGPTKIAPYVSVRGESDDNILYSENNETSDMITIVSGGLLAQRKTERLDAKVDLKLKKHMYKEHDELDTLDKFLSLGADYRLTERISIGGSAKWKNDSLRGDDIEDTGILVLGDRESTDISLSGSYSLSEISMVSLSLDVDQTEIREKTEDEDSDTLTISLDYSRNLSRFLENTVGYVSLSYLTYASETVNPDTTYLFSIDQTTDYDSEIWQVSVGGVKDITELWNVYLHAGFGYSTTQTTYTPRYTFGSGIPVKYDSDTFSGIFLAGINYSGLYIDTGFSLSHDMRAGSGTNGAVERTKASFDFTGRVSDKLRFVFNTSSYLNKNERTTGSEDLDELYFTFSPSLRYAFDDDIDLLFGYRYTSVEDRTDDTTRERSLVYLEIKKQFIHDID